MEAFDLQRFPNEVCSCCCVSGCRTLIRTWALKSLGRGLHARTGCTGWPPHWAPQDSGDVVQAPVLWTLLFLSLQMCVSGIFSMLNLTLLFPVWSQHYTPFPHPRPTLSSLGKVLDLAHHQAFPSQTVISGGARKLCPKFALLCLVSLKRRCGSGTGGEDPGLSPNPLCPESVLQCQL